MKGCFKIFGFALLCFVLSLACFAEPSAVTDVDAALESVDFGENDEAYLFDAVTGDGTIDSPYIISSAAEFNNYSNIANSGNPAYSEAYYQLSGNIDFSGRNILPFGTVSSPFKGHFDGNGYEIYNIDVVDVENFGVIGYITKGSVKNLSANYSITSRKLNKLVVFGGIVGYAYTDGLDTITISGCETIGDIKFSSPSGIYVAGVVGRVYANRANIVIDNSVSYCNVDVTAVDSSTAGGFAGHVRASSAMYFRFDHCVAYGNVSLVTTGNRNQCGGFAGYVYKDEPGWLEVDKADLSASIVNFHSCLAFGDVVTKCDRTARIGGFAGKFENTDYMSFSTNRTSDRQYVKGNATFLETSTTIATDTYENLTNEDYLKKTLTYDLKNKWYYSNSDSRLYLRETVKKNAAATLSENAAIRLSKVNAGLRFIASIEMFKRDYVKEYGFILTTEKRLGDNELTFDFDGKYVSGAAYNSTTDIFFDKNDENISFSGVLYNIPVTGYNQRVVARTYLTYVSGGVTYTVYGNQVSASLSEMAIALKNDIEKFDSLSEEQKQIFNDMFPEL